MMQKLIMCSKCWPRARMRMPLILVTIAAAVHMFLIGYQIARWDQVLYLPLIHGYVDASTFSPHDAYMQAFLWKSYTTFFLALTPFVQWFGWEWPVFLVYAATKLFLFLGFWALAFRLTRDHRAATLAVLFLVGDTVCKGLSAQIPSSTLICRFVVMPFLFFGLERFLARRFRTSAVLFGLAFQIHALTTSFWLVLVVFIALFDWQRLRNQAGRPMLQAILIFAAFALPMIVWHALTPTPFPTDYSVDAWMEIVRIKNWYSFIASWSSEKWQDLVFCFALVAVVLPRLVRDRTWRPFAGIAVGTLAVLGLHYFISEVILFRPLFQLQWIRIMELPALIALIAVARVLARAGRGPHGWVSALAATTLFVVLTMGTHDLYVRVFTLASCAALAWGNRRILAPVLLTTMAATLLAMRPYAYSGIPPVAIGKTGFAWENVLLLAVSGVAFAAFFYARLIRCARIRRSLRGIAILGLPALLVFVSPPSNRIQHPQWGGWKLVERRWSRVEPPGQGMKGPWFDVQRWVHDNTPKGTMFFTPPGQIGFRVLSERSTFIEYTDGEVSIFDPNQAREWKRRMQLIGYWPPAIGGGSVGPAIKAYHAIPPERWLELAREHRVDYLVTNRKVRLPFEKLHAVGDYTLWKITDNDQH